MLNEQVQKLPSSVKLNILSYLTPSRHFIKFKRNCKTQLLEEILLDGWMYWYFRSAIEFPKAWPVETESERRWWEYIVTLNNKTFFLNDLFVLVTDAKILLDFSKAAREREQQRKRRAVLTSYDKKIKELLVMRAELHRKDRFLQQKFMELCKVKNCLEKMIERMENPHPHAAKRWRCII